MPNARISDLTDGGGDITLGSLIEIETAGGNSRKVTLQQLIEFMGITVSTVAGLPSSGASNDMIAFASDGRKDGEGVGSGTGVLATAIDSTSWTAVDDGGTVEA